MTLPVADGTPPVEQVIRPVTHDLGGFKVHRVLPSRTRTMVGPFIFVDEFGPATLALGQAMDVRPHPHINLSTVTYLFEGAIDHRDSVGTVATITPGAVNLMTAGSGIVHSERSPADQRDGTGRLFGMQTWNALPDALEEMDPAFEHIAVDELPVVAGAGARARVIMGSLWGESSPTTAHAPTIYADIVLEPGGAVPIDAEADERAVMLVDGAATLGDVPLEAYTLYVLAPGAQPALCAGEGSGARVMLLGGAAFATPRHVWWNFVSSRRDRIEAAKEDWRQRRFAPVPGEHEAILIPDQPKTVSYL